MNTGSKPYWVNLLKMPLNPPDRHPASGSVQAVDPALIATVYAAAGIGPELDVKHADALVVAIDERQVIQLL